MAKNFYWPGAMPDQLVLITNFKAKIAGYAGALGLTAAQLTLAELICEAFIIAFNFADQSKGTMQAVTQWREDIFYGEPTASVAPPPPIFPVGDLGATSIGVVKQFFELRDQIVASPGYTLAIGEDLKIVGTEKTELIEDEVAPSLKPTTHAGYEIQIKGSMQGMNGMRVEYRRKGGEFAPLAFFTNLPGTVQITPAEPGEPESGELRAIFIKKNAEFGNFSPNYPVTVA